MAYEKIYIGKGTQVPNLQIAKVTLKLEEIEKHREEFLNDETSATRYRGRYALEPLVNRGGDDADEPGVSGRGQCCVARGLLDRRHDIAAPGRDIHRWRNVDRFRHGGEQPGCIENGACGQE